MSRKLVVLASAVPMFIFAATLAADRPPLISPFVRLPIPHAPGSHDSVQADDDGNLWLSERSGGRVVEIGPEGRVLRAIGSKGEGLGKIGQPVLISISGSILAVDDQNKGIHLFNVKTGDYLHSIASTLDQGKVQANPSMGFFLDKDKLIFCGAGFPGDPPRLTLPADVLTIFSSDLTGGHLKIVESKRIPASQRVALALFGYGFGLIASDGTAVVCHSLPGEIVRFGREGDILARGEAYPAPLPDIPLGVLANPQAQDDAVFNTPHAVGLFTVGSHLGAVWHLPSKDGPRLVVRWMDQALHVVDSEELQLPIILRPTDMIGGISADKKGNVYLLVVNREGGASRSDLFVGRMTKD